VLQLVLPVFLSAKPIRPWPAAPWLPMNDSCSVAARQIGGPAGVVAVVLVLCEGRG